MPYQNIAILIFQRSKKAWDRKKNPLITEALLKLKAKITGMKKYIEFFLHVGEKNPF